MLGIGVGRLTLFALPPTLTGWAANTPDFASAAGQTPVTKPVMNGTGLTGATSFKLNGVEHISNVTVTATTITINTVNAGSVGAFTAVQVTTPAGVATYGNGTTHGWTYLPAGYHIWRADLGVTFGVAPAVSSWADQGDLTANDATQATTVRRPVLATSVINSLSAMQFSYAASTYFQLSSMAALTAGHMFAVVDLTTTANNGSNQFGSSITGNWIDYSGTTYEDFGITNRYSFTTPAELANAPAVYEASASAAGAVAIHVNGTSAYSASGKTIGFSTAPSIGAGLAAGESINGYEEEILVFNTVLSGSNLTAVKAYLYGRTGISGI